LATTEAHSTSNHFKGVTPFKVQVNFDIPLFEGQIYVNALEKWLNLLEGYFSIHNFPIVKRSPSRSLRPFPMSEIGGRLTMINMSRMSLEFLGQGRLGRLFFMLSRNNITLLEVMMTNTLDGPHCAKRGVE
jgi:hypothetical protein